MPDRVCNNPAVLEGPSSPPPGAVTITPVQNLSDLVDADGPNTTFWLSPGTYTLGNGPDHQIIPKDGDTFIGAPGAVIDGENNNDFAFTQHATDVTIEYLTIRDFIAPNDQGVVNHDSGTSWFIAHDTIRNNTGAGVMVGSGDVLETNCITQNGQYGFNAYSPDGVKDVTITNNEISFNDSYGYDTASGVACGCAGGGKFWEADTAVITGNYIHDNRDVGLWADTDNVGFDISHNYISDNYAQGILYEISYNARIADNTLIRNGVQDGPGNFGNFPISAIYISQSSSDKRVPGPFSDQLAITGNVLIDNWAGVVLWEDANRFCSAIHDACPLVDPSEFNHATCDQASLVGNDVGQRPVDYYDGCRWHTENIDVSGNAFSFRPADIGRGCSPSNGCGLQGLFAGAALGEASWSPYSESAIQTAITSNQRNVFIHNVYRGPWSFMAHDQGTVVSFGVWQHDWHQDARSIAPA